MDSRWATVFVFSLCISDLVAKSAKNNAHHMVNTSVISNAIDGLFVGYDNRLRPYFGGAVLNISVYMSVVSFSNVKEKDMEFSLDVFFKQAWNDPRLTHAMNYPLILPGRLKEKFWIPDTFFINVKTAKFHYVPASNTRIVVKPSGDIELSERLTVTASCRMDLREYPLDTQTCKLELLSYSFDINDIDYHWKAKEDVIILDAEMSEFELIGSRGERKLVEYVVGTYTHLIAKFEFHRRLAYSFIQIYSPTFLIVVLSWLSFWISKDAVPARVALGITTVLTIVTLMGSLRNTVPKVSYIKAIDSYLIVSFIFVFGVLLEYIAVLMHSNSKKIKKKKGIRSRAQLDLESLKASVPYQPCPTALSPTRTSMMRFSYHEPNSVPKNRMHLAPPPHPSRGPLIPGPAINHSPYAAMPQRSRFVEWCQNVRIPLIHTDDKEVDIFDRLARVFFPLSFLIFNVGYYFRYR